MNNEANNCLIAQSGGPTSVINSSLCGVIEAGLKNPGIDRIYGAKYGIEGILKEYIYDLTEEDREQIRLLKQTPSSALGSCRYKLKDFKENDYEYVKIFEIFKKYGIGYFFYIGGNDSMDTVDRLSSYAETINSNVKIIGIPKTIDNDLFGTDHSPGFGSAAKFIVNSVTEIARDSHVYNKKMITLIEVMGRNAGWLAGASALSNCDITSAPDLIYLPEAPFTLDKITSDIERLFKNKNIINIVVSEGIVPEDKEIFEFATNDIAKDNFGHSKIGGIVHSLSCILKKRFNCDVKSIEFNTLQRASISSASKIDINEAYKCGRDAVGYALKGETGKAVIIKRISDEPYKAKTGLLPVSIIANKEKKVPIEWINAEKNYVTEEFIRYVRPLIQGDVNLVKKDGLPRYSVFKSMR